MNPFLKRLGFGPQDRVVIIHADDIATCHAANAAFAELWAAGAVSSAALIVPGPWFGAAAAFCRDTPAVDMGVHLALNAEFATCRWGPLSTRDPASGLLDKQGYLHATVAATLALADPEAVARELHAQVAQALAAGIDVTHIDAHMFTAAHPPFFAAYLAVALEHRLPLFFPGLAELDRFAGDDPEQRESFQQRVQQLEQHGLPVFDATTFLPLGLEPHGVDVALRLIDSLRPGLTMLILHPLHDTPEARALTPDWPSRVSNYQTCLSQELREHIQRSGVQLIGYRALRDAMRGA
ncbi:MAG: carbohydrate deacetylase [Roseiflexaceae bacterium]